MKGERILFIDTETGGIDSSKHSLLTIALVVWENYEIVDAIEIPINDGKLFATQEALRINNIILENHKIIALNTNEAFLKLLNFIDTHFDNSLITLAGHNVNFDVGFLRKFFIDVGFDFHKRFSHRFVDTSSILYYLYLAGKIKYKAISSQKAFELFAISVEGRHTARGDALATAKLFSVLLKIITKRVAIEERSDGTFQLELFE